MHRHVLGDSHLLVMKQFLETPAAALIGLMYVILRISLPNPFCGKLIGFSWGYGIGKNAGVPLKPMLAKICEGIPDALRQLKGDFIAEFKYDGMRSQIHLLPNGTVKLFSRNCAHLLQNQISNRPRSLNFKS